MPEPSIEGVGWSPAQTAITSALRAFGAPAILLVWLYVMANVIVLGAELNWWRARRAEQRAVDELAGLA